MPQHDLEMFAYSIVAAVKGKLWEGLSNREDLVPFRQETMKLYANTKDEFLQFASHLSSIAQKQNFDYKEVRALTESINIRA